MSNLICPYLKECCCEKECVMWDEGCIIRKSLIVKSLLDDDLGLDDEDDIGYLSEEEKIRREEEEVKIGIFRDMSEDEMINGLEDYIQEFRVRPRGSVYVPNIAPRYWERLGVRYIRALDIEEKKAHVEQTVQSIIDSV